VQPQLTTNEDNNNNNNNESSNDMIVDNNDDDDDVDLLTEIHLESLINDDIQRQRGALHTYDSKTVTNAESETMSGLNWQQKINDGDDNDRALMRLCLDASDEKVDKKMLKRVVDMFVSELREATVSIPIHIAEIIHPNCKTIPFKSLLNSKEEDGRIGTILLTTFRLMYGLIILYKQNENNNNNVDNNDDNDDDNDDDIDDDENVNNDHNNNDNNHISNGIQRNNMINNNFISIFSSFKMKDNDHDGEKSKRLSILLKARKQALTILAEKIQM